MSTTSTLCGRAVLTVLLSVMPLRAVYSHQGQPASAAVKMSVRQIAFAPDGGHLAAACGDSGPHGCLAVWEWTTGRSVFVHHEDAAVTNVSYSPSGKLLAIGMLGPGAKLVSPETGEVVREFRGHAAHARSVAFPSDEILATGSYDRTVRLWDTATGNQIAELGRHDHEVRDIAATADGKWLISGARAPDARLWNIAERKEVAVLKPSELICPAVGFSRDSTLFLTGRWDGTVHIQETESHTLRAAIHANNRGFDLSPDNRTLIVFNDSPAVQLIRVTLYTATDELKQQINELIATWHDDNYEKREEASRKLIELGMVAEPQLRDAMTSESPEVRIRARRARAAVLSPQPEEIDVGHRASVGAVRFSPDGSVVATGDADGVVKVWNLNDRKVVAEFRLPADSPK